MLPPVSRGRRPSRRPRRRRSAGDTLAALGAVLVLLGLLVGLPVALVSALGPPVPHAPPSLSLLTHQLDILAILRILSIIVWLAWLQLLACVIAELRAAVRNTGMPPRVPLAGGLQPTVHRLVTAALLSFSAATALSSAVAHQALPAAAAHPRGPARPGASPAAAARSASPAAGPRTSPSDPPPGHRVAQPGHRVAEPGHLRRRTEKIYVVQPPEGRYHESLWEIAQNHLGDGRRYREIFELNAGRVQPDGAKLTIARLIRPGWVLRMPRDAYGPGIEIVTLPERTAGTSGPGPAPAGPALAGPIPAATAQPAASRPAVRAGDPSYPAVPVTGTASYPAELAAAALLAAGVLSALGRRRRAQLWHRAVGRRVAVPVGPAPAAAAEVALRLGASEPSARLLDTGLRYLAQSLASQGRTLPTVFAAHLGSLNLDLWVDPDGWDAPAPWMAVGDGQVWRLPLAAAPGLGPGPAAGADAPYPGLVSIGTDANGRVLVDLASAPGLIAVTGAPQRVRALLAAMTVELVTSRWSGAIGITLVGFGADLTALAPGRVTAAGTLTEALPALAARAEPVVEAPPFLISAVPPSAAEREQLLAHAGDAAAAGYVVAGDVAGAAWTWEVTAQGRLRAGPLGLDVQAQLLPPDQCAAVVDLFWAAEQLDGVALGVPSPGSAPAGHLLPDSVAAVEITLLGPVRVTAPGVIEPDQVGLATELVVFVAAHPGGVHPNVLAAAIWPRGVTREVRDATLAQVQDWLGADDIGRTQLAADASGLLRLGSQVQVDWQVFCALMARAAAGGEGSGEAALEQALSLVGGPFLDGREPGRYAWLASDGLEYEVVARVADAAHRLCQLRLAGADPEGAMAAARAGLRLASDDELLWRDLLTAADATGQQHRVRAVVNELRARAALDEVLPRLAPETEALIEELLPSRRSPVA
jgi:hypothetical protein